MADGPPPPEYWNYEDVRAFADGFLDKYWPSRSVPIPIEHLVDVEIGLDIIPVEHLRSEHDVEGFLSVDRRSIYVDYSLYSNPKLAARYRFTIAHEVGHWLLHEPLYEAASFGDFADWKEYLDGLSSEKQFFYENQAYCFAGLVLVPREHLSGAIEVEVARAEELSTGFKFDSKQLSHCEYLSGRVARIFEVSEAVVLKRGHYDEHWKFRRGSC